MSTHTLFTRRSELMISALEFTALVFVLATLSEFTLHFIADIRHATIIVGLIGFAACLVGGIAPTSHARGWTSSTAAFGILLGVVALLLVGHACCGYWLP